MPTHKVKLSLPQDGDVERPPTGSIQAYEHARKALDGFYRLKPHLGGFARAMTGDPNVTIEPTGGASATDGKTIFVRVNPELARDVQHDRRKCGKRNALGLPACPACDVHEGVIVPLYHEIGHIAYNSFQEISASDKRDTITKGMKEARMWGVPEKRIERYEKRVTKMLDEYVECHGVLPSYVAVGRFISKFMPMLMNVVEDARVNALVIKNNPGMRVMFEARTRAIFEKGVEQLDGSVTKWSDAPPNAQALIGVLVKASGYSLDGWLSEQVEADLDDPQLTALCDQVQVTSSARDVFLLCFPILDRLRELGYCQPEELEDGDSEPDGVDTDGTSDETGDSDSADASGEPTDDESDEGGAGSSEEPDDDDESEASNVGMGDPLDDLLDDEDDVESDDAGADGTDDDAEEDTDPDDGGGSDDDEDAASDDEDASGDGGSDDDSSDPYADDEDADDGTDDAGGGSGTGGDGGDESSGDADDESDGEPEASEGGYPSAGGGDGASMGEPDEVESYIAQFGEHKESDHDHDGDEHTHEEEPVDTDMETAIDQHEHFDAPSQNIVEVNVSDTDAKREKYFRDEYYGHADRYKVEPPPERLIQKSLGPLRVAFSENRKGSYDRNRRSGRVNARVLGRRVPVEDNRIFKKKKVPGRRDYHVVLGLDVSYSTSSRGRIEMIKEAAWAQGELLSRLGVNFEIFAHTGSYTSSRGGMALEIIVLKALNEPWSQNVKNRLLRLMPVSANLDGHTMEYYRKRLDASSATDRILMYYTDGAMPAENFHEEKAILERECRTLKQRGYEVVGVGVQNDDPTKYGLDTVRIDSINDIDRVVEELRKRLTKRP